MELTYQHRYVMSRPGLVVIVANMEYAVRPSAPDGIRHTHYADTPPLTQTYIADVATPQELPLHILCYAYIQDIAVKTALRAAFSIYATIYAIYITPPPLLLRRFIAAERRRVRA